MHLKSVRKTPAAPKISNNPLKLEGVNLSAIGDPLIEHPDDAAILSDGANSGEQISTPGRRILPRLHIRNSSCGDGAREDFSKNKQSFGA
ncbi:UNVERIFIED_CONTAM: hypothetical protein Slati_3995500 [Sesamum latifolium]|uniref:Uncharacterized protein n=1 Tax=Sesamum latifolium TaxID=2727402 RepID=A0AAW2TT77_9LAMI